MSPLQQVPAHLLRTLRNFQLSLPLINKDNKYYTPSFILEEEKNFYHENDMKMLKNHEEKMEEMVEGLTGSIVIIFPLPRSDFSLFLTYLVGSQARPQEEVLYCLPPRVRGLSGGTLPMTQHIHDTTHKEKINKSRYTGYIRELAADYQKRRKSKAIK